MAAVPVVVAAVGHIAAPVTAASMVRTTTRRVKRTLHLQMRVRSCQWCSAQNPLRRESDGALKVMQASAQERCSRWGLKLSPRIRLPRDQEQTDRGSCRFSVIVDRWNGHFRSSAKSGGGNRRAQQETVRVLLFEVGELPSRRSEQRCLMFGAMSTDIYFKATTKIEQKHAGRQRRTRSGSRRSYIATCIALIEIAVATAYTRSAHSRRHSPALSKSPG